MLLGLDAYEIINYSLILLSIFIILFLEEIKNTLKIPIKNILIIVGILCFTIFIAVGMNVGISNFVINLSILIPSIFIFVFGFLSDRKYIYGFSFLLLLASILLNIIGLNNFSEYTAILFYLTIVLGVFRDLFYEKIFSN